MINNKLEETKKLAKLFLNFDIQPSEQFGSLIVSHPFFTSAHLVYKNIMFDALENEEMFQKYRAWFYESYLATAQDISSIMCFISKPYKMTFLLFLEKRKILTKKECGNLLGEFWEQIEFPLSDANVSKAHILSWFRNADKTALMNQTEMKKYADLPDVVTVYRGCDSEKKINGFSWTLSKNIAKWFSQRWGSDDAILLQAKIDKKDVFAYFEHEQEIVLNYKKIYDIMRL